MSELHTPDPDGDLDQARQAMIELEHRKHDVRRRLEQLEDQRRALDDVRDLLAEEVEGVAERLSEAKADQRRIDERLRSLQARRRRVEGELDQLQREIAVLEQRFDELVATDRDLTREVDNAREQLRLSRSRVLTATTELELGRAKLTRMDRKLTDKHAKR